MFQHTDSQAFPAGSKVRDRITGDVHTVAAGKRQRSYTSILIPGTDDRTMILPTGDLEAVEGAGIAAVLSPAGSFDPFVKAAQL